MKQALYRIAAWLAFPVIILISFVTLLVSNKQDTLTLVSKRKQYLVLSFISSGLVILFIVLADLTAQTWLFLSLSIAACCIFLLFILKYLTCIGKASSRIAHLLFHEWDPEQFDSEFPAFEKLFSKAERNSNLLRYFRAIACMNRGDYTAARGYFGQTSPVSPLLFVDQEIAAANCIIRCGNLCEAEQICIYYQNLLLEHPEVQTYCNEYHIVGLYALESGDRNKAMWYFRKAMEMPAIPFTVNTIVYDYGRLMELEGHTEEAIKHYTASASFCPKTWVGQEAARRAAALQDAAVHAVEAEATP